MHWNKVVFLTLLLSFVMLTGGVSGQFRNWDRFEIGFNYLLSMGTYSGVSTVQTGSYNFQGDTTNTRNEMTKIGYGFSIGTSIPFKRLGHESMWCIDLQLMYNEMIWGDVNKFLNTTTNAFAPPTNNIHAVTQQFTLPFGIDYKVGCDAIKTQRKHLGATFGAGFMFLTNGTSINGSNSPYNIPSVWGMMNSADAIPKAMEHNTGFNFGFDPYAKIEVSFFTGLCYKLRLMASYGKLNYYFSTANVGTNNDGPFRITGLMNVTASLVIMPFSYRWTETHWWNTYDTYNPFEKLH